ncbi:MAG: hypothetical protein J5765_00760 [Clostridia bacterium]|nr:hypothetical protein [Clostridia bacterium]
MRFKRVLLAVLSIFTIVLFFGMMPSCNNSPPPTEPSGDPGSATKSGPKFVAHKGYSQNCVENTEKAFRAAAALGFYGIETDIRKTKDGYFVCNHDATVEYADESKKISMTDRADLLSQPIKNDKNDPAACLCTFEKYLKACKDGNKIAVIELKDYVNDVDARKILEIIDAEYDRNKVTFISFVYLSLKSIQKEDPSIPLQFLLDKNNAELVDRCIRDEISIDVKYTLLTEEMVQAFHDAGLTVNVWTVNDESILQTAYQMGVDYVTTDVFYEE